MLRCDALASATDIIVEYLGAVSAQFGRQSDETIPHKLIPKYHPFR